MSRALSLALAFLVGVLVATAIPAAQAQAPRTAECIYIAAYASKDGAEKRQAFMTEQLAAGRTAFFSDTGATCAW